MQTLIATLDAGLHASLVALLAVLQPGAQARRVYNAPEINALLEGEAVNATTRTPLPPRACVCARARWARARAMLSRPWRSLPSVPDAHRVCWCWWCCGIK